MYNKKARVYFRTKGWVDAFAKTIAFEKFTIIPGYIRVIKEKKDTDTLTSVLIPIHQILQVIYFDRKNCVKDKSLQPFTVCLELQPMTSDAIKRGKPDRITLKCTKLIVFSDVIICIEDSAAGQSVNVYAADSVLTLEYDENYANVLYDERGFLNEECNGYDL